MPPIPYERYNVYLIPKGGIANLAAPTVAEIGAGVDASDMLTDSGVAYSITQNKASAGTLNGTIRTAIGSRGNDITLTFNVDTDDTEVRPFFDEQAKDGIVVISEDGPAIAGAEVEVREVTFSLPNKSSSASDTMQTYAVECGSNNPPVEAVVVA